ncbi:hypothetical protein GCM10020358_11170 [Amorphoplanes nipponensis]
MIEPGAVLECPEIKDKQRHVYTLTTTADNERLLVVLRALVEGGDSLSAWLTGADGETSCYLGSYPNDCVLGAAGTYTIAVTLYSGSGSNGYVLGLDSRSHPSSCATLTSGSLAFPTTAREGTLAAGSAGRCHRFEQAEGALVRIAVSGGGDVRGQLENAAGEEICYLQDTRECTLTGAGPYHFFLTEQYGNATTYQLAVTRLSDPDGCADLTPATFGGPGEHLVTATIEGTNLTCATFTTAVAGLHLLTFTNAQYLNWRVADHTGAALCTKWGENGALCPLPAAGTYTLFGEHSDSWAGPQTFTAAVYPLATTAGCGATVGTSWDAPRLEVPATAPLLVGCNPLDARPGDRIDLRSGGWITDGTGARICDAVREDDETGCVLPGPGPYRVITEASWSEDSDNRGYSVEARRLNDPQGCATVAAGRYNAAPAGPLTASRCRILSVPAAGAYHVDVVDKDNYHDYGTIYDRAGKKVCGVGYCTFPAAGPYTLTTDGGTYATVFLPAAGTDGCVNVSDQPTAAPVKGAFTTAGQLDCLLLPTPTGAGLALLKPQDATGTGRPEMTVSDAGGRYECDLSQLRDYSCVLEGTAPFRVLLHLDEDTDTVAGPYALSFARTTGGPACPVLPSGAQPSLTLGGDKFAGCFTLPAGQHAAAEALSFQRTAGTGKARLSVFGPTGTRRCGTQALEAGFTICDLEAGAATVLVEGSTATGTYRFSRKDVTSNATGCQQVTSTVVGGPSLTGTLSSRADLRCYQVAAAATDRIAIDTRDQDNVSRTIILDPDGKTTSCAGYVSACAVTGKTKYQVLVWSLGTGSTAYQLDVWKVWSGGKPPAECAPVPSAAYGFGPYTGTLSSSKPAMCVVAPATYYDDLDIDVSNPVDPDDAYFWDAGMYAVTGSAGMQSCAIGEGGFHCWSGRERLEPTVYLLTNGNRASAHPYRLEAICRNTSSLCGGEAFTVTAAAPASVATGGKRTFTVTGTALHLRDTVVVTPAGGPALTATVKTVSADRRTLTAEVDLTTAPAGPAAVSVDSFGADDEPVVLAAAFTVTLSPLRATKAPAISGTVAVGSTVKVSAGSWTPAATSYAYQWRADGAAIRGAGGASLLIPAAVLGKRLTVTVTASRSGYPPGTATSPATAAVAKGRAPAATKQPAITGTAKVGRTVKVSAGTWSPRADSYRYEWRLNGKVVKGATAASLKLTSSMRNKKLTVTVTARRAGHADGRATAKAVTVRR